MDTRLLVFRNLIRFFTKGDTRFLVETYNDLFCLFLSQIVYFSPSFIIKQLTDLGSENIKLIDYNGPTAVCLRYGGITYISVKGLTGRNRREWPIVLNVLAKEHEGTEAHGGFVLTTRRLLPSIRQFVALYDTSPVVLTGHSMGGAIATLTSLSVSGCKVVTFGAPKVIERDAVGAFAGKEMTHYRIDSDFVTYLPPIMYVRPGTQIIKDFKLRLFRFWESHKLYTYGKLLMPTLTGPASSGNISELTFPTE